jgi:hypothetical protein
VLLVSGATSRLGGEELFQLFQAPRVILLTVAYYTVLALICLWIRRTDHHRAWLLAVVPNPILAFCVALLARLIFSSVSVYALIAGSGFPSFIWIGLITLCLERTADAHMDVPDLDFSIGFAGFVNSIALLLLPVDFLMSK